MRKYMLLNVLFMFLLFSCSGDTNKPYIGTWIDSYEIRGLGTQSTTLSLYEDNSCKLTLFGVEMVGTWSVMDDVLTLKLGDRGSSESLYSTSKFIIVRINEKELFLKKPGTNDVTEYYKKK